jgi:hypothetical protein
MRHMHLADFASTAATCRESRFRFEEFRQNPAVMDLGWPDDVLEQLLYDHADNAAFLKDYGRVDLSRIHWDVEALSAEELAGMPTGPSDQGCIDEYAADPNHWINVRKHGPHLGAALCWDTHGTWKRWPILIDRLLLEPPTTGFQIVEGRTRVGILRGRMREGSHIATNHLAWIGRAAD